MADKYEKQQEIRERMLRLRENFKKDGADRKSKPEYFKSRSDQLNDLWTEFLIIHERFGQEESRSHKYFFNRCYERTKEVYEEVTSLINTGYQQLTSTLAGLPETVAGCSVANPRQQQQQGESSGENTPPGDDEQFGQGQQKQQDRGLNSRLDEMYRKQGVNIKAFLRTVCNINIEILTDKWELDDALKTLESRWSVIDYLHWEIESEATHSDLTYQSMFDKHEKTFNSLKKEINKKIWSVAHREKSTPMLDIPTFYGNYNTWVSFKDLFNEAIHKNTTLSNAQKMQFLKSKLKGEAERLIQHLQISSDNYLVCWEILNNRYNNTKLIFTSHINILFGLPNMQQQSMGQIKKMYDTTTECLHAIRNLGIDISTWDPILVHILSQKLDTETHKDYIESLKNSRELPVLQEFLDFIESKFTTLESSRRKQDPSPHKTHPHQPVQVTKKPFQNFNNRNNNYNYNQNNNHGGASRNHGSPPVAKSFHVSGFKCPLCKNPHGIYNCRFFLQMPVEKRYYTINRLALCVNCLFSHNGNVCNSTKACNKCGGQHNTLIHEACVNANATPGTSTSTSSGNASHFKRESKHVVNASHVSPDDYSEILLATALIKVKGADDSSHTLRALIDQGSQISLITEQAAQMLNLKRERCQGVIYGVGQRENNCKGKLNITCTSMYNNYNFTAEVIIMNSLIKNLPNKTFTKPSWPIIQNINLADPEFYVSRPVDILLGADIYSNILLGGMIKSEEASQPMAQQTQLGWLLCGNAKTYHCNVVINSLEDIKQFWEVEDIAEEGDLSQEDITCIKHYQENTKRQIDGRYVVSLPMKPNFETELGESRTKAIAQFRNTERKFERQEKLAQAYKTFMTEYSELEHMTPAKYNSSSLECYLPHHGIERVESTTTKYRVVFNASAKTSTGRSLNDLMYTGPNLQQDLQSLLLKWRQYEYAFTADIEKMYRQILVNETDQQLQKIIWRESPEQPLQSFQLTTVTYGTKAAPFLAMMTLRKLAADERANYPNAAKVVEESFYMDDLVHGAHSIEQAQKLIVELDKLLQSGGFHLRKWSANKEKVLENVTNIHQDDETIFNFKTDNVSKTLGLCWNPKNDTFSFKCNITQQTSKPTKRNLLSEISKLFDPLGWLAPVNTKLKIIFQRVWKENTHWDEQVSDEIYEMWSKVQSDIDRINECQIPRWIASNECDVIELHGFCDASMEAYACVVYAKMKNKPTVVLIAGKSKLVPHKKLLTLPRLELSGAYLLTKLITKIKQSLNQHKTEIFGWTDSKIVLGWLQGQPNRWKPFVANRVKQIQEVMPEEQWRYVKSSENPADAASRGLTASQLIEQSLWWQGPTWLPTFIPQPEKQTYNTTEEEKKQSACNTIQINTENLIDNLLQKHNSFTKVQRIVTWILRALTPRRHTPTTSYLTLQELQKAKLLIIKHEQMNELGAEIKHLRKHGTVDTKSKLLNLKPFIDHENVLRVGGRLEKANISDEMKHPKIIPKDTRLATLLIDQAHKQTFHGGARVTMAKLRQEYWITGGNNEVKKQIRKCVTCRRNEGRTQKQLMGDLPAARVNQASPFYHTGVDYTGHVDVKANRGRGAKTLKGYIAIFICMVTKAVHLELVTELTSSAFLAALRRMAARRGAPRHLYSDNGTNFVGANRALQEKFQQYEDIFTDSFMTEITEMKMEWHFNAPAWPSAGGLWERAVRSLKHHLKRVVGEQKLTFEEYSTILAQLEACLNSRPLCSLSEDVNDIDFLTPAHFLNGRPGVTIIETDEDARTRWHLTQKLFEDIWKKWKFEYLSQLTARRKWQTPQRNLEKGDVVVIHEENLPPGKWALGRVVEAHPGPDGYVRVVTLKTKNGTIKRPVVKLSILPLETAEKEQKQKEKEQKEREQRKTPKKQSILSTIMMFMYFMTILATGNCVNVTPLNRTQGLYFDKIGKLEIIRDEWKLVAYYDLEPYWEGTEAYMKYNEQLEAICHQVKTLAHCDIIMLQLRHSYEELQHYNRILLKNQLKQNTRKRRGLINGVGYLANTLFGVLDDRFVEQYEKDIGLIHQNEKHLAELWKNQTSIVEAEYNLLKRTEITIQKQHKMINQHLINLEKATNEMKLAISASEHMAQFTIVAMATNNLLTHLRNIQEYLIDTITNVYDGRMNIHTIDPQQLQQELNIISGQLNSDLTLPIDNIQRNLDSIYRLLKIRARITDHYMIFEIRIPLISRDSYDLYNLISIPKSVGENMISLTPIENHVAMNLQKDAFLPIVETDLQHCLSRDTAMYMCYIKEPIYKMSSDTDLCVKDETRQCKQTRNLCQNKWMSLSTLNNYFYFCCDRCQLRTHCMSQVTSQTLTGANILSMNENCIVKTDNFSIHTHQTMSNRIDLASDINVPKIDPINNIINITIPKFEHNLTFNDQKELLNIEEQIKTMKESQPISEDFSVHDVHQYAAIYVLWGIVALVLLVIVGRKVRCLRQPAASVATEQRLGPAAGSGAGREPGPQPAARHTPAHADIYSVIGEKCGENSARVQVRECINDEVRESDKIRNVKGGVTDKTTSPVFRKISFE
ncbi:uncharacterized protein LOC114364612 [Ostrinia furnacalis]|uniref:uncharacterized protein LOC114364612 n=1 Tax=Ostrinia furnacalis TaxID=93504 RepID=UPI0010395493|nr:uncharacterized protein LOC114364612 [Ostrinia furnacalis]